MSKKIQSIFVYALFALFSNAFGDYIELDVIIRDFPVGYPGFEEFDAEKRNNGKCTEKNDARESKWIPANRICFKGNNYIPCSEGGEQLGYGRDPDGRNHKNSNGESWRGYCNGPDRTTECRCNANGTRVDNGDCDWANPVGVTKGMVGDRLDYSRCSDAERGGNPVEEAIKGRYCARPKVGNGDCYGDGVADWFTDGGQARRFEDVMRLDQVGTGAFYEINYDYNTKTEWRPGLYDNGYFPLDKKEGTYGLQSLNVWCPKDKDAAGITYDLGENCRKWNDAGGGKNPDAAKKAVDNGVPARLLHNYGFSMAGSGEFKFDKSKNEEFQFIGDDDMWIFIDGDLFVDLGGTHLAAPAKINITEYGNSKGWEDGSQHAINFFYLDRQTDGSNMKLRISISNLTPSRFGAPRILKAETTQNPDGSSQTTLYVNNKIENIRDFIGNDREFPILVRKSGSSDLYAYRLESVSGPENAGSEGYAYIITGQVCKTRNECGGKLILSSGDSLSFNVKDGQDVTDGGYGNPGGLGLSSEDWYIKSTNGTPATTKSFAVNTTSMPPIVFKPDVTDDDVRKPDFNVDSWFTGDPGGGKGNGGGQFPGGSGSLPGSFGNSGGTFPQITQIWDNNENKLVDLPNGRNNTTVHGFGVKGTPIPPNRAGELILTAYPNAGGTVNGMPYAEWEHDSTYQKLFGMPPVAKGDNLFGIADPTVQQPNGGYMFVKNGFKDESSVGGVQIAPTRCVSDRDELVNGESPRVNCLNFSLVAKQPFRLTVTVYDQLGNFVTQYSEKIDEKEFRSVVQAPTFIEKNVSDVYPSGNCRDPKGQKEDFGKKDVLTINGLVKVNVNVYPFSSDGRRFGNGVYIVKIDRVDLPYEGCMNSAGNAVFIEENFMRYHADTKFGWVRTN